jgi:hypothetical protein
MVNHCVEWFVLGLWFSRFAMKNSVSQLKITSETLLRTLNKRVQLMGATEDWASYSILSLDCWSSA